MTATNSPYPDDNPKTAQGAKKIDLSLVPPSAIIAEARVMGLGAKKYGPYNWREKTVSARVYTAAAMRHLLTWQDGEDADPESGESHLAHARACLGILIDAASIGKLNDNRAAKGAAGRLLVPDDYITKLPNAPMLAEMPKLADLPTYLTGTPTHWCAASESTRAGQAVECEPCKTAIYGPRTL